MLHNNHTLSNLNPAQLQAVTAINCNLLVLAGAGSGKTRVLVERIAWLIQTQNISPSNILAVTFTNKAALEMKTRLSAILGFSTKNMWVGTFHSIAHRLLRMHWRDALLPEGFQIIDAEEQLRLIKKIQKELNIDDSQFMPKETVYFINNCKESGMRAKNMQADDRHEDILRKIYFTYEEHCHQSGLVDFTELLLRAYELWNNNSELLTHYRNRFNHILVDEFQDTNKLQYIWLKLLSTKNNFFTIVGDDDQSIYGWRGACVENIRLFTEEFANNETIRLEQNYRSTKKILAAANALIAQNSDRLGKDLWTESKTGDPIYLYHAYNEFDEARFVIEIIKQYKMRRLKLSDIAILYRSNVQSRVFEQELITSGIAYKIYGGFRFFERAEIKDALAYLRVINNLDDNSAFERIINWPTRGIGEKTLSLIRSHARDNKISLWESLARLIELKLVTPRVELKLTAFINLINDLMQLIANLPLSEQVDKVIKHSGLITQYQKERGNKGQERVDNLQELVVASEQFKLDDYPEMEPLSAFLTHAVLESGENQAEAFEDSVNLMTLHSAKGLEFDCVFLVGMEECLFPHRMSMYDDSELAEERRLCYVGITRARHNLYLSYAEYRRLYGREEYNAPSRFLRDIPADLIQPIKEEALC